VSTLDHPGLLSKICESIDSCDLMVKDAKISTLGEEANDIFIVVPPIKILGLERYK
jgi:UTP:GlnB (protein PII) uridylyltransferase